MQALLIGWLSYCDSGTWNLPTPEFQSSLLDSPYPARMGYCQGGSQGQAWSALHHVCSYHISQNLVSTRRWEMPGPGGRGSEVWRTYYHLCHSEYKHIDFIFHSMLMAQRNWDNCMWQQESRTCRHGRTAMWKVHKGGPFSELPWVGITVKCYEFPSLLQRVKKRSGQSKEKKSRKIVTQTKGKIYF